MQTIGAVRALHSTKPDITNIRATGRPTILLCIYLYCTAL